MEYVRKIDLDVNMLTGMTMVKVKQGDNETRFLNITLYKDGVKIVPTSSMEIQFRCHKPDGHAVVDDVELENDGTITVEMTSQIMAVTGKMYCDICIENSTEILSSVPFIIEVVPAPDVANRAASTDEFGTLSRLIQKCGACSGAGANREVTILYGTCTVSASGITNIAGVTYTQVHAAYSVGNKVVLLLDDTTNNYSYMFDVIGFTGSNSTYHFTNATNIASTNVALAYITVTSSNVWAASKINLIGYPSGGSTGDVLKKTANGVEWGTVEAGGVTVVHGGYDMDVSAGGITEVTDITYDQIDEPFENGDMVFLVLEQGYSGTPGSGEVPMVFRMSAKAGVTYYFTNDLFLNEDGIKLNYCFNIMIDDDDEWTINNVEVCDKSDIANKITYPSGGSNGYVLKKSGSSAIWAQESGGGGGSSNVYVAEITVREAETEEEYDEYGEYVVSGPSIDYLISAYDSGKTILAYLSMSEEIEEGINYNARSYGSCIYNINISGDPRYEGIAIYYFDLINGDEFNERLPLMCVREDVTAQPDGVWMLDFDDAYSLLSTDDLDSSISSYSSGAPKTSAVYNALESKVPSSGTTGYVLTKTGSGTAWAEASGGSGIEELTDIYISESSDFIDSEVTYSQINTAYNDGKAVVLRATIYGDDDAYTYLYFNMIDRIYNNSSNIIFKFYCIYNGREYTITVTSSNVWTSSKTGVLPATGSAGNVLKKTANGVEWGAMDISGCEVTTNKVTSWSATTTDTNYPSEKLVKDSIDSKMSAPSGGVTGNSLVKTSDGYAWGATSASDSVYIFECSISASGSGGTITCSTTYNDILTQVGIGKEVILKCAFNYNFGSHQDNTIVYLKLFNLPGTFGGSYGFVNKMNLESLERELQIWCSSTSLWNYTLTEYEDINNKIISWPSSSLSDNNNYPSAKLVKDSLDELDTSIGVLEDSVNTKITAPSSGNEGQYLRKTYNGVEWSAYSPPTASAVLTYSGWSNNTQTVDVNIVNALNIVAISPSASSALSFDENHVLFTEQGYHTATFTCSTVPDEDITIYFIAFGD